MALVFSASDMARFWPNGDPAWVDSFVQNHIAWGNKYGLKTPGRWHHFLAQVSAETDGLRTNGRGGAPVKGMRENLNHLPASLLKANSFRVKKAAREIERFRSLSLQAVAAELCRDHTLLAESLYGGRVRDLGNSEPGDGAKFIGRGPLQCTGRYIYTKVSTALGIDCVADPDLLSTPRYGWEAAFIEWQTSGCNALADTGDVEKVSRRVNGGTNGLAARHRWFAKATAMFDGDDEVADDTDAREQASLADLSKAGSRTATTLKIARDVSVATAGVSVAIETADAVGTQMQTATGAMQKIKDSVGGVITEIGTTAEAAHALAKVARGYVGVNTLVPALLVAVIAVVAGHYFLQAYRSGRYRPRPRGRAGNTSG